MKADPKAEAAPQSSKKKLLLIIIMVVLVLGLGGGAAWFFTQGKSDTAHSKPAPKKAAKPVFVVIEPFTVNLQPENGEQYLQIQFTLQVGSEEESLMIKDNMARIRSRVLLLLSAKKASELTSTDGKQLLSKEIIAAVNLPFVDKGDPQEVSDVLFTSFIIQ